MISAQRVFVAVFWCVLIAKIRRGCKNRSTITQTALRVRQSNLVFGGLNSITPFCVCTISRLAPNFAPRFDKIHQRPSISLATSNANQQQQKSIRFERAWPSLPSVYFSVIQFVCLFNRLLASHPLLFNIHFNSVNFPSRRRQSARLFTAFLHAIVYWNRVAVFRKTSNW